MRRPRCPRCGGFVLREPAAVRCLACGERWEADADDAARLAQRLVDWWLRPRSVECWAEYQDLVGPPAVWPGGHGWVKLPSGRQHAKKARR